MAPTKTSVLKIEHRASPEAEWQVMHFPVEPRVLRALRVIPTALTLQFSPALTSSDVAGLTTKAMEAYFSHKRAKGGKCSSDVERLCKRAALAAVLHWNPALYRRSGFLPRLALPTIDVAFEVARARLEAWEASALRPELKEFLANPTVEPGRRGALVLASALIGLAFEQRLDTRAFVKSFERGFALESKEGRTLSSAAASPGVHSLCSDLVDFIASMTNEGMNTLYFDGSGMLRLDRRAVRDLESKTLKRRSRAAKRESLQSDLEGAHEDGDDFVGAARDAREWAPHQRLAAAEVLRRLRKFPRIAMAVKRALADSPASELEGRIAALERLARALKRCWSAKTQAAVVYACLRESREWVAQVFNVSAREIRRRDGEAKRLLASAAEDDR